MNRAFSQAEARWLEPPEYHHHRECESFMWYYCTECKKPFSGGDTKPKNMHDECGTPFGKTYHDCVCEYIEYEQN